MISSDGYVKFVVHPTENKAMILEIHNNDETWASFLTTFVYDDDNMYTFFDMDLMMKVNPNIRGCLVLATYYQGEIANFMHPLEVIVVCRNYKQKWRKNLLLKHENNSQLDKKELKNETEKWNRLYNQELPIEQYYPKNFISKTLTNTKEDSDGKQSIK